jgi:hypothetical protein
MNSSQNTSSTTTFATSSEARNALRSKAPILILNGFAFTIERGWLLGCTVGADGHTLDMHDGGPDWSAVEDFTLEPEVQGEIDLDSRDALIGEYDDWCNNEKLPHVSADEQDLASLDSQQRRYIRGFIQRWERVACAEAQPGQLISHNEWLAGRSPPRS